MAKNQFCNGAGMNAALENTLAVELFLNERYLFRRNVLNGKVEYLTKADSDVPPDEAVQEVSADSLDWRPLTQEALNSNKFDKEMALTNNLFVCLDELEAIRPSQHAALKQTLSKAKVNGRPIYGCAQEDRPRFASFVATTNNPHPLTDPTGSRRYICIEIPDGQYIDNSGEIDYGQLYAQAVYELQKAKTPYWFSNDEVARIQQLNQGYMQQKDIAEMVEICFRKPKEGEASKMMNSGMLLSMIQKEYPSVDSTHGNKVRIGQAMKSLGYESTDRSNVPFYKVVLVKAA